MARIPQETIDQIRDAADILDVVGDYVPMKKQGRNFFGNCPFHQEKTASFSVNQQRQIYHCFGCGVGGNAYTFIMEMEKVNFPEAVQRLGQKVGIEVDLSGATDPRTKATVQQIMDLHEAATVVYQKGMNSAGGQRVQKYLADRGINEATQALFKIGYVPDKWDTLKNAIGSQKYSNEAFNQSGLFMAGDRGAYDRFRGRIMFPLANKTGKIVGFAGRVFENDNPAKYLNSPESPIYHKSDILYGLALNRNHIRDADAAIIVEGYLDLIQLYQAGIKNVVAVSGTALTDQHARELRKLTTNIYLSYDGDRAGIQAAIRGGYVLLRNGVTALVVPLPPGLDPDDWILRDGPEPYLEAVTKAVPVIQWQIDHFLGDTRKPGDLRKLIEEILRELVGIKDNTAKVVALNQVSNLTGVNEAKLQEILVSIPRYERATEDQSTPTINRTQIKHTKSHQAQLRLLKLCFQEDELILNLLADQCRDELFSHPLLLELWQMIAPLLDDGQIPDASSIFDALDDGEKQQFLSQLLIDSDEVGTGEAAMLLAVECLQLLMIEGFQTELEQIRLILRQSAKSGAEVTEMMRGAADNRQKQIEQLPGLFNKYLEAK